MKLSTKKSLKEANSSAHDDKELSERLNGFKVLKYTYAENSSVIRNMFLKKFTLNFHKDSSEDDAVNRTLLIANVPPFFNENHARFLFEKRCEKIQKVYFEQKPSLSVATSMFNKIQELNNDNDNFIKVPFKSVSDYFTEDEGIYGYKACYIVFSSKNGLVKALEMTESFDIPYLKPTNEQFVNDKKLNEDAFCTGLKKMKLDYNKSIIPPKRVIKDAEAFVDNANIEAEEKLSQIKRMADMKPDEDGWITVNRKLRRNRDAFVSDSLKGKKLKLFK